MHKLKNESIKPTVPASRTSSSRKGLCLGIVLALKIFYRFLNGRRFTLQTDLRPLLAFLGSKKGLPTHTANRLNYDFRMEFLPSSKLCHTDGLSRLIQKNREPLEDTVIASLRTEVEIKKTMLYYTGTTCDSGRNKK